MIYTTVRLPPRYEAMSLNDLLFSDDPHGGQIFSDPTATITYGSADDVVSRKLSRRHHHCMMRAARALAIHREAFAALADVPRESLYRTFYIPKKSGGLRTINAPNAELSRALREFKAILEQDTFYGVLNHTAAFAYIKGRCTVDAVKRHQKNESKWFAKFDIHDFFGSTTQDFVLSMFRQVYPLSSAMRDIHTAELIRWFVDLAFLNGGLPQGTPVSPTITNIMMVPFDAIFSKWCREHNYVYTRYADDMIVSSRYGFDFHEVENKIVEILRQLGAPFELNTSKTRYGSSKGKNWNLGVMLNDQNQITVGHKNKRRFQSMLYNYATAKLSGTPWSLNEVQVLAGLRSYYTMIEGETIDNLVHNMSVKLHCDISAMIKHDLASPGETPL